MANILGTSDSDNLQGTIVNDVIRGLAGGDAIFGFAGDDQLFGDDDPDGLDGGAGNDLLDGGAGLDAVNYAQSPAGVVVNLAAGTAQDGLGGTDTLVSIEQITGSDFDDTLIGNDGDNTFRPGDGNDLISGAGGTDTLDYFFNFAPAGIVVNLATGSAQDGHGTTDTIIGIENVVGSELNDRLVGDGRANTLDGGAGNDRLVGGEVMISSRAASATIISPAAPAWTFWTATKDATCSTGEAGRTGFPARTVPTCCAVAAAWTA